jgi:hypothetical protein
MDTWIPCQGDLSIRAVMAPTTKPSGKKESRRGIALSDETIERIRRAMAAAVLRGIKDYPQSVSAFVSAATDEKLTRDLAEIDVESPSPRSSTARTRRKAP